MTYLSRCPECLDTGYATDNETGHPVLCHCDAGKLAEYGLLSITPYDMTDQDNDGKDEQ